MSLLKTNMFYAYANKKDTDHPCCLFIEFVVLCLESEIDISNFHILNFKTLTSLLSWAGMVESNLIRNPDNRPFWRGGSYELWHEKSHRRWLET